MKTKLKTLFIASLLTILSSCNNNTKNNSQKDKEIADNIVPIKTVKVEVKRVEQTESYPSSIIAYTINNIAPVSAGVRICTLNNEVGDRVRKGCILAETDNVQLNQARLKLLKDSTEYVRIKSLYAQGGVSKSDFETMELTYKVSRSNYNLLKENTILRSPIDGIITERNYDVTDIFSPSRPIYIVQQITPVKIPIWISESDYTKVKKGNKTEITTDALPGEVFYGKINRIEPILDPVTHTFRAEVLVENKDMKLRPGMFSQVKVFFGTKDIISITEEAIIKMPGSGQRAVYIIDKAGTAKLTPVTLGKRYENDYEVISGLCNGDEVATECSSSLKNGNKVKVLNN